MISDRSYMRDENYRPNRTSVLTWMLCAIIAGFLLQVVFSTAVHFPGFENAAHFSWANLQKGWGWSMLTYTLLHGGLLSVIFNCIGLYYLGNELIALIGERRLVMLYIGAALCGAGLWLLVNFGHGGSLIGVSAVISAFLMVFACFYPDREMTFLILFIPVTVKPKHLVMALAAFDTVGMIVSEIFPGRFNTGIAHSSHIGGMLAGLAYYRFVHLREWKNPDGRAEITLPKWLSRSKPDATDAPLADVVAPDAVANVAHMKAEVDRILDKINSHGFGSLTAKEKRLLDEAKDQLSRR